MKATAHDDHSGVASFQLLIDNEQLRPDDLVAVDSCNSDGCPSEASAKFTLLPSELPQGAHTIQVVVKDMLGNSAGISDHHVTRSASFILYSVGPLKRADPTPETPDDPDDGPTDETPASVCDPDPDFPEPDYSCLPDESADVVVAARAEGHAGSSSASPLLVGGWTDPAPTQATTPSACPLKAPITQSVMIAEGRRFGLSDQTGFASMRDVSMAFDTFTDIDAQRLNVQRVRLVVPFDLIPRALAQKSISAAPCREYLAVYQWIKNAVEADPKREPLVSFERRRSPGGPTRAPDPVTEYRPAVKAFLDAFPAVRAYTAWNEPDNPVTQPTAHRTTGDADYARAVKAGRYWRHLNLLCQRGKRCLVAAGDFTDARTQNNSYRSRYFKGMGKPARVAVWAYHPYGAIEHGPTSTSYARLQRFLDSPRTDGSEIWLTEAGAHVDHGTGSAPEHLERQRQDLDVFLNTSSSLFNNSKVKRFYYYAWTGGSGFDTGLVGNGALPPINTLTSPALAAPIRPVYCTYVRRTNPANPNPEVCPP